MSCIELLRKELKKEFPSIDKDLQTYIEGDTWQYLLPPEIKSIEMFRFRCVVKQCRGFRFERGYLRGCR